MNRFSHLYFFLLFFIFLSLKPTEGTSQKNEHNIQTIIHLLGYVSMDYPQAVQNGKIISRQEFDEQIEFSNQALILAKEGNFLKGKDTLILKDLSILIQKIENKKPSEEISLAAGNIKNKIITITGIATAPQNWPDIESGKKLYIAQCMDCHGAKGNGEGKLATSLDPQPTNFLNGNLMSKFSPYQAYNTIKLGVEGTSMRGFSELSDKEVWNLAFFIKSLPHENEKNDTASLRKAFDNIYSNISLSEVATLSDNELLDSLKNKTNNPIEALTALRLLSPTADNMTGSLTIAINNLNEARNEYATGNKAMARTKALKAYLEGIEPVEARLRTISPTFVSNLESQMLRVRQAIEKNKDQSIVAEEVQKSIALISQANQMMRGQKLNYWLTFILAGSIFLREGLEAFLILAVVLALIRTSGVKKALPWLHGGWIAAVGAGIAGWFLSDYIVQFGGKNREIMEGLVSLVAVVILISVGFWLHSKTEAKQWTKFIKEKIGSYLQRDKMFGLAAFSFVIVFREAFEVILFLQAVSLEASPKNHSAIGLGVMAASFLIMIIAYLFLKYAKMVPIRKLFLYSSWIIVLLAVILMGKGFHALQESGWVGITEIPSFFRVVWLGIYPTVQTLLAQLALILLIIIVYFINVHHKKHLQLNQG